MHRLLYLLGLLLSTSAVAQQRTLSGTVRSAEGEPLIGATVLLRGTDRGTATDYEGKYALDIPQGEAELTFSYTGMRPKTVAVGNRSRLDVTLQPDVQLIDEVVVTAYAGEQKQKDLVGSYEQVEGDELLPQRPIESFDKMLEGQVAGVQVELNTGEPGLPVQVRIRGNASLPPVRSTDVVASGQPLFVLDGVPLYDVSETNTANTPFSTSLDQQLNPLMFVRPEDIASITVLKDASATAIYGANAANGVVLITTKQGQAGQPQLTGGLSTGFSNLINEVEFLNTEEYVTLARETFFNSGENPANAGPLTIQTDWPALTQRQGSVTNASLSLSGGNSRTKYFLSGGYYKEHAISRGNGLERVTLRSNLNTALGEKLDLRFGFSGGYVRKESFSDFGAFTYPPNLSPFNEDGTFNNGGFFINRPNPVAALAQNEFFHDAFSINNNLRLNYEILPGLEVRVSGGLDGYLQLQYQYESALNGSGRPSNGRARRFTRGNLQWVANGQLSYQRAFGNHHLNALAGVERNKQITYRQRISASDFPSDQLREFWTVDTDNIDADESNYQDASESFYAQASYDFGYRYYLTLSGRRDASSIFGGDVQAANFLSAGAAWAFTQEPWMESLQWLNFGKLRASYGLTGNSRLGTYSARGLYGYNDAFLYGGNIGIAPTAPANEDLTWELVRKYNFAVDLEVLESRIRLTVEHYRHYTEDAIYTIPVPRESGFDNIVTNAADQRNIGWEASLETVNTQGELRWATRFNMARNRNQLTRIEAERFPATALNSRGLVVGQNSSVLYGVPFAGVDPYNGKPLYYLPDGSITDDDDLVNDPDNWVPIGQAAPDWYGGMTNTVTYKGLSLAFLLSYSYGGDILVNGLTFTDGRQISFNNQSANQLDRWQQPGDLTDTPRLHIDNTFQYNSTRYLFDNDFLRLANVNLSYRLPGRWLDALGISSFSLTAQGNNLGYLYSTRSRANRNGIAEYRFRFPEARGFMFGLNVTL